MPKQKMKVYRSYRSINTVLLERSCEDEDEEDERKQDSSMTSPISLPARDQDQRDDHVT